jgi:hypothetical protein
MFLALVEPQIHFDDTPIKNVFTLIKEYYLKEFYDNIWVDEIKMKRNKLLELIHISNYIHPLIRNYSEIVKKKMFHIHLVKKYKEIETGNEYVVLHTYKLNIFKRIWRKKHNMNLVI